MREKSRPRRPVSPTTLRLLTPLFRHSSARDAYVLRIAGGRYGPVLVDRTRVAPLPPEAPAPSKPTGRFARTTGDTAAETAEKPVTQSRQH